MQRNQLIYYSVYTLKSQPLLRKSSLCDKVIHNLQILVKAKQIKLYGYVILPNRVDLVWELKEEKEQENPRLQFLKLTSIDFLKTLRKTDKRVIDLFCIDMFFQKVQFWQKGPQPVEITSEEQMQNILLNMHEAANQIKPLVQKYPYPYSSDQFYTCAYDSFSMLSHYNLYFEKQVSKAS
ncbi:MAG: hypothetical protein AAGI07_09755 [Bacteroidota bacterium]